LTEDGKTYDRLARAIQGNASLVRAPDWESLVTRLPAMSVVTVVLDLAASLPPRVDLAARSLVRRRHIALFVLLYNLVLSEAETSFQLRHVADDFIVPEKQDDATIRRRVLANPGLRHAVNRVRGALHGRISPSIEPYAAWCLTTLENEPGRLLRVKGMVTDARRSRARLDRIFADAKIREPRRLIAMVHTMVAVALMEFPGRNTASVAEELGFSSAGTLCESVKHATGKTLGAIRESGGIDYLANLFEQRFGAATDKWRLHATLGQAASTFEAVAQVDFQLILDLDLHVG